METLRGNRLKTGTYFDFLRDRLNIFYIIAFLPLLAIEYYRYAYYGNVLGILTPLFGFLLLYFKKEAFSQIAVPGGLQRAVGSAILISSFFTYYVLFPFFPMVGFYGISNYVVYLLGLLLIFFDVSALKKSFTPFFLMVTAALSGLIFRWLELQLNPYVPYFVRVFSFLLSAVGLTVEVLNPYVILVHTSERAVPMAFEGGCIGVYSLLIFSIILVAIMIETSSSNRTKLLWSIAGLVGIFIVNILRLFIVLLSISFYGYDIGQQVHKVIGYILFLSWTGIFFYMFSKRQTIRLKMQSVRQRIAGVIVE